MQGNNDPFQYTNDLTASNGQNAGANVDEERERIETVWKQRAVQMAIIERDLSAENQDTLTVVLIRLGRELLGIDVQNVFDIRPKEAITRVPRVPAWVVGVTNLRGNILSVIDLRKYLGLPGTANPEGDPEQPGLLLIVQTQNQTSPSAMEIVFLVDDVVGVETLPVRRDVIESGLIHRLKPEYVKAIVERSPDSTRSESSDYQQIQRHITIIDAEVLLVDPRLVIHEEFA